MDWRLKALAFRALDLPGGSVAHYFLQRHVTRSWPRRAATLDGLRGVAAGVVEDYARHLSGTPQSVLEVGAGRDLAVPLAFRKLGVEQVIASDVNRLAKLDLVRHAAHRLSGGKMSPESWADLARLGIVYRAPHYVSDADPKVECSCSNEVLEHVPVEQLVPLLAGLRAVTTGLTVHSIDYSDHFARSDRSISRFNFLKYDDRQWRPFNSGMQFVNRLRHSDYVRLFREAGFTIVEEDSTPGDVPDDVRNNIAPQFRHYAPDDLFALKGRIVAR